MNKPYGRNRAGIKACANPVEMVGEGWREAPMVKVGLKWVGARHKVMEVAGKELAELAGPMSMVCLEWL